MSIWAFSFFICVKVSFNMDYFCFIYDSKLRASRTSALGLQHEPEALEGANTEALEG